MSAPTRLTERETEALARETLAQLDAGKPVRVVRPGEFRLALDRPVPFLCVYRRPAGDEGHVGLNRLTVCQTASVLSSGRPRSDWKALVSRISAEMEERFGDFLVIELWELDEVRAEPAPGESLAPPAFQILTETETDPVADVLLCGLRELEVAGLRTAEIRREPLGGRAGAAFFGRGRKAKGAWIGLGIAPIYRDPESGHLFPRVLSELELALREVLWRTFREFCCRRTSLRPTHYQELGRRHFVDEVKVTDRHLERVSDTFSFLLMVTPENSADAWEEFQDRGYKRMPRFVYRPLAVDPEILKRTLYDVDIEKIEDPTIGRIFREKQLELERQITMLQERGTPNFCYGSLMVYGGVEPELLKTAADILRSFPCEAQPDGEEAPPMVGALALQRRALKEIEEYRKLDPTFKVKVTIRDDIPPGMLVHRNELLIGDECAIPKRRVAALLHHEIGTHLVTYFNGRHQRLRQLCTGLAGYEGFQEGTAVMAEYLVGGLTGSRLRVLAARVVACERMLAGVSFVETFHELVDGYGFGARSAFTLTNRIYRGGGLTKDAIYLRGFIEVCEHLATGGALEMLFVGKIARKHLPDVEELVHRKILEKPFLMPNYLHSPGARKRLQKLRTGFSFRNLWEEL